MNTILLNIILAGLILLILFLLNNTYVTVFTVMLILFIIIMYVINGYTDLSDQLFDPANVVEQDDKNNNGI